MPTPAATAELDTTAMYAAVAKFMLSLSPHLHTLRIVGETPDGKVIIPVPLPRGDEDLESRILSVLGTLAKDARMGGAELALKAETERDSGHFKRTIGALKESGKIDVHKLYGYRLA